MKLAEAEIASASEALLPKENDALLKNDAERDFVRSLLNEGQAHLFADWPSLGDRDDDKRRLLSQLTHLDRSYVGGLLRYIQNARRLLEDSRKGVNPFEGCKPSVPEGENLDFGSSDFLDVERRGVEAAADAAFVLVAGGLGERLGYSGIKLALPSESASGICFLQLYIESILALQKKAQVSRKERILPLAIMTSDDTHSPTIELLESRNYFGASKDQITLLKQEKVPCLADNEAHLALSQKDSFSIQTKPHGHGDVHALLHASGLAEQWQKDGFKWICFFQDTNAQVFKALLAALGVSETRGFDVNSLAVPRRAKEAIGAITRLERPDATSITINVEYNQLDPLLRETVNPEGDVNDPETGFSPFPGNINQLVIRIDTYVKELERHGGMIAEFVNPKYVDPSKRTDFKSSTRLECMMQDFPKNLPQDASVGFTLIRQVWAAYSPVKNSPADAAKKAAAGDPSHSATSGELDLYMTNCKMLETVGAKVDSPKDDVTFNGIAHLRLWPRVVWSPLFAITFDDLEARVEAKNVHVGSDTCLVIRNPRAEIKSLDLKRGSLVVDGSSGKDVVDGLLVDNDGWEWMALKDDEGNGSGGRDFPPVVEEERIRGFRVVKRAEHVV